MERRGLEIVLRLRAWEKESKEIWGLSLWWWCRISNNRCKERSSRDSWYVAVVTLCWCIHLEPVMCDVRCAARWLPCLLMAQRRWRSWFEADVGLCWCTCEVPLACNAPVVTRWIWLWRCRRRLLLWRISIVGVVVPCSCTHMGLTQSNVLFVSMWPPLPCLICDCRCRLSSSNRGIQQHQHHHHRSILLLLFLPQCLQLPSSLIHRQS